MGLAFGAHSLFTHKLGLSTQGKSKKKKKKKSSIASCCDCSSLVQGVRSSLSQVPEGQRWEGQAGQQRWQALPGAAAPALGRDGGEGAGIWMVPGC